MVICNDVSRWFYVKIVMKPTWPLRQGWWGAIALIGCMLIVMNNIWPLRQGWLLPNKKTNENGHFAPPSGIQMIFSVDLDIKFLMKKSAPPSGMLLPWRRGEIPDGGVALTQREELKFHRVINNDCWLYTNVIHIDTTPMTSDGIMTLCKHRLAPSGI